MIDPLFQPKNIGFFEIKNRIFMPAMHLNMCRNFMVIKQLVTKIAGALRTATLFEMTHQGFRAGRSIT